MKKLLILMLFPVMASLAGADLIIMDVPEEVEAGEPFSLTIYGSASDVSFLAQIGTQLNGAVETKDIEADDTTLNFPTVANGSTIVDNFASRDSYDYNIVSPGDSAGITADGLWITINFTAGSGGEVYTFTRLNNSFIETDVMTTTVLPEPMTMAILALGGLMVRRKR